MFIGGKSGQESDKLQNDFSFASSKYGVTLNWIETMQVVEQTCCSGGASLLDLLSGMLTATLLEWSKIKAELYKSEIVSKQSIPGSCGQLCRPGGIGASGGIRSCH